MTDSASNSGLTTWQKSMLLAAALVLAVGLFLVRNGGSIESPLDQLARRSLPPEVALSNGRPTILEFYADWCEVCREMAPAMLEVEQRHSADLDVVLVNIDNPRWLDLTDRYDVTGIPQLNLFSADGTMRGRSLGGRSETELDSIATALMDGSPLPALAGFGSTSPLPETATKDSTGPRSHA
ncbi:MAG: thioredoxin [Cyanobium sp. ARS6]|uniref:thioredoxin domain-containing protein n=1 Tax=Synechococcus sp. MIT S9507 TaxID=3082544 RepID=UPI000C55988B|nr:thioredoxin [Cyanobium sp. ARS6]